MPDFNASLVLLRRTGFAAGCPVYQESAARGLVRERRRHEADGRLAAELAFLLPPEYAAEPGDRLRWQKAEYEIAAVRVCRDLAGEIVARRVEIRR